MNDNPLDAFYDAMEQVSICGEAITDQAENAGDIDEDQDIIAATRANLQQMAAFHKEAQTAGRNLTKVLKQTGNNPA